jgi:hypothetical protein
MSAAGHPAAPERASRQGGDQQECKKATHAVDFNIRPRAAAIRCLGGMLVRRSAIIRGMADPIESAEPPSEPPGRVRTWWHPLLVNLLDWALQGAYEVRDEVPVGRMPPQLDIVILRRLGELSELALRELAPLVARLNEITLLEFKSPTDALGRGDLSYLLGCAFLFHGQQRPPVARGTLTTVILAPALTGPFREDVDRLGFQLHERRPGVWEIAGSPFPLWVLESDRLTELEDTALALFSRIFLREPRPIIEHWRDTEHAAVLEFVVQQIEQFKRLGEAFTMQHTAVPVMNRTIRELKAHLLKQMTPEEFVEFATETNFLELAPPEFLAKSLTPEQIVRSLDPAAREQLRRLLEELPGEKSGNGDAADPE